MLTEDKVIDVIVEEYKALWQYYQTLVAEWNRFIGTYLTVVTLPASLVAVLTIQTASTASLDLNVLRNISAAVLGVIGLVGLSLYIGYAKECRNGVSYQQSMEAIRAFLSRQQAELSEVLVIDKRRSSASNLIPGSIKYWRGTPVSLVNSLIFTASAMVYWMQGDVEIWIVVFLALAVFHSVIYYTIMKDAKISKPTSRK